jgi:beta-lactamase superfamily II metal-dependent hydrolase
MGQGDCCMVRCPDGQVIVVDCGSLENWDEEFDPFIRACELLRSVEWAGGQSNKISALILTHPDNDHHNKVVDLCWERTWPNGYRPAKGPPITAGTVFARINIDKIFFSDAWYPGKSKFTQKFTGNGPLGKYTGGAFVRYIECGDFDTNEIYEITINGKDHSAFTRWKKPFKTIDTSAFPLANNRRPVVDGTTDGVQWKVSIIAGNVVKENKADKASPDNAKSLITLFEIGDKSALLTGDATYSTEDFLRTTHSALLAKVNLVQVPHHGSMHASHKLTVAEFTALQHAVVSVSFMEHKHCHPQYAALENWLEAVKGATGDVHHDIDYWTRVIELPDLPNSAHFDNKWTTAQKQRGGQQGGFCYLRQPEDGVFAYRYEFNAKEKTQFLYREPVPDRLRMTSMETQVYTLSSPGGVTRVAT